MFRSKVARLGACLAAAAALAGCDDLMDPGGRRVEAVAVVDAQGTVVASASPANVVTGSLVLGAGESRQYTIQLRDRGGNAVALPDGASVGVAVTNTLVAGWVSQGPLSGRLEGRSAGPTTLRVDYFVGGRVDYTSPNIPVVVN